MDRKGLAFCPFSTEKMESAISLSVTQIVTQKYEVVVFTSPKVKINISVPLN